MNLIQAVESRYLVKVMTDKKINDAYNWGVALFKSDDVHEFDFKHILRLVNHLVREDHEEIFSYGTSICTKDNEINIKYISGEKLEYIIEDNIITDLPKVEGDVILKRLDGINMSTVSEYSELPEYDAVDTNILLVENKNNIELHFNAKYYKEKSEVPYRHKDMVISYDYSKNEFSIQILNSDTVTPFNTFITKDYLSSAINDFIPFYIEGRDYGLDLFFYTLKDIFFDVSKQIYEEIYLMSRVDEYALMHAKYKDIVIKQNVFIRNDEIVWGFFDESKTITGLELAFRSKDAIMEFLYKIQFMANKESTLTQRLENHFREISYFSGKSINELLESDTRTYLEELVRLSDKIDSTLLDYNISYTSVDEKGNHVIINYTDDKLIIKSKVKSLSNQKDKENTTIEEDEVLDGLMHYASKRARIKKDIAKLSNSRILDDIFNYNKKDTPKGQELPIPIMDKKES